MSRLEDFDTRFDEKSIATLSRNASRLSYMKMAQETALRQHPVTYYVKNLPHDDPVINLYPANMYLQFANDDNHEETEVGTPSAQEGGQDSHGVQSGKKSRKTRKTKPEPPYDPRNPTVTASGYVRKSVPVQKMYNSKVLRIKDHLPIGTDGFPDFEEFQASDKLYITWLMPGHDREKPKRAGCGPIRASDGTHVFKACSHSFDHFIQDKMHHCWDLGCPTCLNDTAMKNGKEVEKRLLMTKRLREKSGRKCGQPAHFVVSPPQDFVKHAMQTFQGYDSLCRYIEGQLMHNGSIGGFMVFHPWRMQDDHWPLGPHFHVFLFGYINTKRFLLDNPGWIIKKIHARQSIRSLSQSIAYVSTHQGIGVVEKNPETIDWDAEFLKYMLPNYFTDADYTEKDYELLTEGKGRMCGDLEGFDWEQWTMDRLHYRLHTRYFGECSPTQIVRVDTYPLYKIRTCAECHAFLRVYDGFSDRTGDFVRYIVQVPIMCYRQDRGLVQSFFLHYKGDLEEGQTVLDMASEIRLCASTLELGLKQNDDPIVPSYFTEPDGFFLERQRRAFGRDDLVDAPELPEGLDGTESL